PVHSIELGQTLKSQTGEYHYDFMNTGVEHVVVFTDDVDSIDIVPEGSSIRYHSHFPKGTNANFAEIQSDGIIKVRTYERGVEDETLACGTGVTAVAIAAILTQGQAAPVSILVRGGDLLKVDFDRDGDDIRNITLTGPAKVVFTGTIEV
ncbi:MAG TPA: diaminopimelate epimerase, partial [Planctomycetaceae bacterium]|nr:diaminopimelate epimerase [Planctomycetaceae bacterium]